jgi:hypothetical protein
MSLLGGLVALADTLTKNFQLQADVVYWPYSSSDGAGRPLYGPPQVRKAIFTQKLKQIRGFSGELVLSNAQIVFLDPTSINPFDKIVTPRGGTLDGSTGARDAAQPILGTDAFTDASNAAILTEIYLGDQRV